MPNVYCLKSSKQSTSYNILKSLNIVRGCKTTLVLGVAITEILEPYLLPLELCGVFKASQRAKTRFVALIYLFKLVYNVNECCPNGHTITFPETAQTSL